MLALNTYNMIGWCLTELMPLVVEYASFRERSGHIIKKDLDSSEDNYNTYQSLPTGKASDIILTTYHAVIFKPPVSRI